MPTVAITGVSGRVGQRLLRALADRDVAAQVVGLDLQQPSYRPRSLTFHAVDLGSADLKPLLEGVDVVVHLASLFAPVPDEEVMARVNIEGTRRLLDAAAATGVGKVVVVSSAAVYGAWPNNPTPITEDVAVRPNAGFDFAVHKAEIERMLVEWRDEHPGVVTTVLRPPLVLGGGTPDSVAAVVRGRFPVRVRDAAPDVQYVHIDDLVSALVLAVESDLPGAYNVAPDGWLSDEDARALAGRVPRPPVPADVADRILRRLWAGGVSDIPPGMVPFFVHPCVVANDRLRAAGWQPRHTTDDAILACVEEAGEPVAGRSPKVTLAVAGGLAVAAAGIAWGALRRRR
ncbi:MAG TPA: NAD-dependent epimerase/dehydratase family protein [Acidimicrobiia bacterium]|nr:NAD-dependent epimerase/dehydratase family protein [Acidimicrobiia bacterium]